MTSESAGRRATVDPTGEVAVAERVLLAKWGNALQELKASDPLPDLDREELSKAAQAQYDDILLKAAEKQSLKSGATGVVVAANLIKAIRKNTPLRGAALDTLDHSNEQKAHDAFEQEVTVNSNLKAAYLLQEHFFQYRSEFLEVCEKNKDEIKDAMTRESYTNRSSIGENMRIGFQLLPSLREDPDLRKTIEGLFSELNRKSSHDEMSRIVRACPDNYLILTNLLPFRDWIEDEVETWTGLKRDRHSGHGESMPSSMDTFPFSDKEKKVVIETAINSKLWSGNFGSAKKMATALQAEDVLATKASELYLRYLNTDAYEDKIIPLDALVPESIKNTPEVINLKRKWAFAHIRDYYESQRFGDEKMKAGFADAYKNQFGIEERLLDTPETQQIVQQQVLEAVRDENYPDATRIYDAFLSDASKSAEFQKQMEQTLLTSFGDNDYLSLGTRSSKQKTGTNMLDLLSDEFKNSPSFRKFIPKILSRCVDSSSTEDINFVVEKLNCTPEEIRLAKQRSLLKAFTQSDANSLILRPALNNTYKIIQEAKDRISPDEEMLEEVRTMLNDAVLKGANFSQLELWKYYGQFLGTSQKQIAGQPEAKALAVQHLATRAQQNNLEEWGTLAREYNLTSADFESIDKTSVMQAIEWGLAEQCKHLEQSLKRFGIGGDIQRIIELCGLEEQIIQNKKIRSLGARFLLASNLFFLDEGWVKRDYQEGLFITDDEMIQEADEVVKLVMKNRKDHISTYLEKMRKLLPNLPRGFADRTVGDEFLEKMQSYHLPQDTRGYGRRHNSEDVNDHLIKAMNLMETGEERSRIATQALTYILNKGAYQCAHDLLFERKVDSFVDKSIRNELLIPRYLELFAENERQAKGFAEEFQLSVDGISDERVTEVYLKLFTDTVAQGYPDGIIKAAEKLTPEQINSALINLPEIRLGIETTFMKEFKDYGFESDYVQKMLQMGLMQPAFLSSPQIKDAGIHYIQTHLENVDTEKILAINSKLGLNLTPRDVIALDPGKKNLFESIEQHFPALAQKCLGSLDALFSLLPYFVLITPEVVREDPFLIEALQENERFGPKLLVKFNSLDLLSKGNIRRLYSSKKEILTEHKDIEVDSHEFREAMQVKLAGYRRNSEIVHSLQRNGINVEEWLGHEEEMYFQLGEDANQKFSEAIVTPIKRMQDTLNAYALSIKEILAVHKGEFVAFEIPLKDSADLQSELDKLRTESGRAENEGNTKKVEGIAKRIAKLEAQIHEAKTISLWEKIMSGLALLDLVKQDVYKAYETLTDAEEAYEKIESDKTSSATIRRKGLKEIKDKMLHAKNDLAKNVKLLGVRLADFDNKFGELITPALGSDRSDSLVQEKNERVGEEVDHYESDSRTLENLFHEKADQGLVGRTMKIAVWNRNPDQDLYLGNYTDCCIRIDSGHMGSESTIADYLTDVGMQVVTITDEKNTTPVAAAWCWIGHDDNDKLAFVIDNIEANTDYSANYKKQMETKLLKFLSNYAKKVGAKLVQGPSNNDLVIAKMDSAYFKVGGYNRPSGYFLEGEGQGNGGGGDEDEFFEEPEGNDGGF